MSSTLLSFNLYSSPSISYIFYSLFLHLISFLFSSPLLSTSFLIFVFFRLNLADLAGTSDNISSEILNEYDTRVVQAVQYSFDLFDVNHKNEILSVELERVLSSLGHHPSMDDVTDLIYEMDPKNTGTLGYNNFITYVIPYLRKGYKQAAALSLGKIKICFEKFDLDGDGSLTPYEFKHILNTSNNVSTRLSDEEADRIVEYLDVNKDETVSWDEFKNIFKALSDDTHMDALPAIVSRALRKVSTVSMCTYRT